MLFVPRTVWCTAGLQSYGTPADSDLTVHSDLTVYSDVTVCLYRGTTGLQSQLLELANGSCAAFVESAECVKRVHEKMTRIANHLARLEAALPAVGAEASILASY